MYFIGLQVCRFCAAWLCEMSHTSAFEANDLIQHMSDVKKRSRLLQVLQKFDKEDYQGHGLSLRLACAKLAKLLRATCPSSRGVHSMHLLNHLGTNHAGKQPC